MTEYETIQTDVQYHTDLTTHANYVGRCGQNVRDHLFVCSKNKWYVVCFWV